MKEANPLERIIFDLEIMVLSCSAQVYPTHMAYKKHKALRAHLWFWAVFKILEPTLPLRYISTCPANHICINDA